MSRFKALLLALAVSLNDVSSIVSAETSPRLNVFFGFDYVVDPLSIKWSCGGDSDEDLSRLHALMAAFPEDSDLARLPEYVRLAHDASKRATYVSEYFGGLLTDDELKRICALALPLNIETLTPEALANRVEDSAPGEQRLAWIKFFQFADDIIFSEIQKPE